VIDTDPGTDDAIAIWLALGSPELDLCMVTVAGGNVGLARTLPNALAITALAGADVPVHGGADRPLLGAFTNEPRVHGADGVGGVAMPPGGPPAPGLAADALRRLLREAAAPVTLAGLAPLTNLALVLATEPALAERIAEIVLMSGGIAEGNVTPSAEFNAWNDPEALAVVLACGRPVRLATLDLTSQALVTPARVAALRALGGGRCLRAACDIMAAMPSSPRLGGRGAPLHDPCAIAWLLAPALFTTRDCAVSVELAGPARGRTIADRWRRTAAPANATLLETLDADAFFALLGARLAALP
jgi:purine nucleosidase